MPRMFVEGDGSDRKLSDTIDPELSWVLDPFAPVPDKYTTHKENAVSDLEGNTEDLSEIEGAENDGDIAGTEHNKPFDTKAADKFLNDLDDDDVATLIQLVASLDRLEMKDGAPRYVSEEIDLIGRFDDFANGREH